MLECEHPGCTAVRDELMTRASDGKRVCETCLLYRRTPDVLKEWQRAASTNPYCVTIASATDLMSLLKDYRGESPRDPHRAALEEQRQQGEVVPAILGTLLTATIHDSEPLRDALVASEEHKTFTDAEVLAILRNVGVDVDACAACAEIAFSGSTGFDKHTCSRSPATITILGRDLEGAPAEEVLRVPTPGETVEGRTAFSVSGEEPSSSSRVAELAQRWRDHKEVERLRAIERIRSARIYGDAADRAHLTVIELLLALHSSALRGEGPGAARETERRCAAALLEPLASILANLVDAKEDIDALIEQAHRWAEQ